MFYDNYCVWGSRKNILVTAIETEDKIAAIKLMKKFFFILRQCKPNMLNINYIT